VSLSVRLSGPVHIAAEAMNIPQNKQRPSLDLEILDCIADSTGFVVVFSRQCGVVSPADRCQDQQGFCLFSGVLFLARDGQGPFPIGPRLVHLCQIAIQFGNLSECPEFTGTITRTLPSLKCLLVLTQGRAATICMVFANQVISLLLKPLRCYLRAGV